jgi:pimeloyl-ACP methyl ester carboxylesterase
LQNAKLEIIENAHHAVPMERPEAFNKTVLRFINEQAQ